MNNVLWQLMKTRNDLCLNMESNALIGLLPDKLSKFLGLIEAGQSENKISRKLYNSTPSGRTYQLGKSQLIDNLIYTMPFINGGDKIQKEKLKTHRYITAICVFELFGLESISIPLARRALKKCESFHMWYEAIFLTRILSQYYSINCNDIEQGRHYYELCNLYSSRSQKEIEFYWAYSQVRNHFRMKTNESDPEYIKFIGDELSGRLGEGTMRCHFLYYAIRYTEYFCRNDFYKAIDILKEALDYFNQLDFNHTIAKNFFTSALIQMRLLVNEPLEAEELIIHILKNSDKNSHQNFRYQELLFRIKIHNKEYLQAKEQFDYLEKHHKRYQDHELKDRMIIYELYLNLLSGSEINFRKLRYRFNRLNQDKEELLIPFKIGEIAYMYINDTDKLIDALSALNQYAYRVFKNKKYRRTALFVKIITQIMTQKPYDLKELSESTAISNNLMELVNYNYLIDFLLEKRPSNTLP